MAPNIFFTGDSLQLPLAHHSAVQHTAPDQEPDLILTYKGNLSFLLATSFLSQLAAKSVSSSINYEYSCGQFHVYDAVMLVFRATNTRWGSHRGGSPISVTDDVMCFYVTG